MLTLAHRHRRGDMIPSSAARQLLILSLRLIVGGLIVYHGGQKLSGGVRSFQLLVDSHDIPLASVTAWAVTALELGGGSLIIFGLLTRLWALLLAAEMILIAVVVRLDAGLVYSAGRAHNIDLLCLSGSLMLVFLGPGRWSLDRALGLEPFRRSPTPSSEEKYLAQNQPPTA